MSGNANGKDKDGSPELPAGLDWKSFTPEDSPKTPIDVFADPVHQDLGTPRVAAGDPAFDFERPICDFSGGVERKTGDTFHLLSVAGKKPVALIFGSYT